MPHTESSDAIMLWLGPAQWYVGHRSNQQLDDPYPIGAFHPSPPIDPSQWPNPDYSYAIDLPPPIQRLTVHRSIGIGVSHMLYSAPLLPLIPIDPRPTI